MDYLALTLWTPIVGFFFFIWPPKKALLISVMLGALFLPMTSVKIMEGVPLVSKSTLIGFAAFLCLIWKFTKSISEWRIRWIDLPMIVWCFIPIATSISNDLGFLDGLSACFTRFFEWGVPYWAGRIVFTGLDDIVLYEKYLFLGGLIYVPLCLIEIRFSPQLHNFVYGYHQHGFGQTLRMGGFRPTVFMQHGLAVALWMLAASLSGFTHLIFPKGDTKLAKSFVIWAWVLIFTFFLCKSTGAIVLFLFCAMGIYLGVKRANAKILKLLIWIPPLYIGTRSTGLWSAENLVKMSVQLFGEERAESLAFRIMNENLIVFHAWARPFLGWGGWGRAAVINPATSKLTIFDGLWGIAFGVNGYIGLVSITLATLIPVLVAFRRFPPKTWALRDNIPVVTLMFIGAAYAVDNLLNNMPNSFLLMGVGALLTQGFRPFTVSEVKNTYTL